jgi:hypothetical protein
MKVLPAALTWVLTIASFYPSRLVLSHAALLVQTTEVSGAQRVGRRAEDPLEGCLEVPQAICLEEADGRSFVVSPSQALPDLVLWYQFDKSLPVDESGHSHHLLDVDLALTPLVTGPGVMSRGGSGSLDGRAYRVASTEAGALSTPTFTVALWIFLLEDSVDTWRTIFNRAAGPDEMGPSLLLWPDTRRLRVGAGPRGNLDSSGLLPLRRWTHVTVTSTGSVLRLYVNGVKDSEAIFEAPAAGDDGSNLYIGRDPWRAGTKAYVDEFRWYSRALSSGEIKALTLPMLTGFAGDSIHLGCPMCTFVEAAASCGHIRGGHVCSLQELMRGGFHIARANGWLRGQRDVWYVHETTNDGLFNGDRKLGLCCVE